MDNFSIDEVKQEDKKPTSLIVLSVLTGIALIGNVVGIIMSLMELPITPELIEKVKLDFAKQIETARASGSEFLITLTEQQQRMALDVLQHASLVLGLKIILLFMGGAAVFLMLFKRKKLGFHLYVIYCIFEFVQMYFYTSPANISMVITIGTTLISGIFIFMYSRNLYWLK